ncbi:phage tail domain-containing protein [Virgibacillus oceani]|uniref:Phage tail protein n=1 Tax=Virgibacillus oceani TaxID=1479511 RepID=A0A917LX47_9BACI|nr:phage tail domain-containing protein [Virgibacillus oceani]GGG64801.1 hypothetical protein GCM10011398_05530 [Virgibacillus oceani]
MKSELNFKVKYNNISTDMHDIGLWVESFHIFSPNAERTKLTVPGMAGSHQSNYRMGERKVHIALQIESDTMIEYDEIKHKIYELFYTEKEFSIIRDLTPDKEIFVIQEGDYDIENITQSDGEFSLTLTMLDPYLYGPELTPPFPSDVAIVTNNGTADADPIIELEVMAPITFAMVQNQNDEYMMIGRPAPVEQEPVEEYTKLINDNMSTLVGWGDAVTVTDGYLGGEIESDGIRFFPRSFGTAVAPLRWQGPGLVKSLPEEVQDFEMNVTVRNENVGWETGMVEAYLLDSLDRQIVRIHLSDSWKESANINGRVQLGHDEYQRFPFMTSAPDNHRDWNNFYGIMKLQRRGNRWWFYFARISDDKRVQISHKHYIPPIEGIFQEKVAKVQIVFRKWPNTETTRMGVYHLNFWKINDLSPDEVPIIADVGDIITFDHVNEELLINGEDKKSLKDFGGSYFGLKPGENQLIVHPSNAFNTNIRFRERFK